MSSLLRGQDKISVLGSSEALTSAGMQGEKKPVSGLVGGTEW